MTQQSLFNNEIRVSVDQFNKLVNMQLEAIGGVVIEGEVTEFSLSKRGGVSIVLKDKTEQAIVNISGYAPRVEGINLIEVGMEVAVWGVPQLYSPYGKFSVSIYKILPLGEGALAQAFALLKAKLDKEGLFDLERKRELPKLVSKIALITAKDSAAESDFMKILRENEIGLNIDFYPVAVQGKHAVEEIINTIRMVQTRDYDCLVLIRGGGSLEDLSAFNDEVVAREVFASKIVSIVAVGHERDESIAEFAADIRASTPSQAAYYLVVNQNNLIQSLELSYSHITNALELVLNTLKSRLIAGSPAAALLNRINQQQELLIRAEYGLSGFRDYLVGLNTKTDYLENLLNSLNPKKVLKRGYSIIRNNQGKIIKSVDQVLLKDKLTLELSDGKLVIQVTEKL